ncbi:hypothetical protein QA802_30355 [Streptomyces sp. B21-105]|uniref:hypothetical protein n=1 Tax=Streptomyces sp. B21-105 TaxID=3039417 RepID=UPI002FF2B33E
MFYTPLDTPDFELRITWRLDDSAPSDGTADPKKFTVLKMGEKALAAADQAYVYFACRSNMFSNPTKVAHIVIGVEHWAVPKEPEGNIEALKDAYATVAHSVSLAMAKELRCEKNGGLPGRHRPPRQGKRHGRDGRGGQRALRQRFRVSLAAALEGLDGRSGPRSGNRRRLRQHHDVDRARSSRSRSGDRRRRLRPDPLTARCRIDICMTKNRHPQRF